MAYNVRPNSPQPIDNQASANSFVNSLPNSAGGGPQAALRALILPSGRWTTTPIPLNPNPLPAVTRSLGLPIVLGTTISGGGHWVYLTGVANGSLVAADQQNPGRALSFTRNNNGVYLATGPAFSYQLTDIRVIVSSPDQVNIVNGNSARP